MSLKPIVLIPSEHRGQKVIFIQFDYDTGLISLVKELNTQWSQSKKCWYMVRHEKDYQKIIAKFKGKAWVDASQLFNGNKPKSDNKNPSPPAPKKIKGFNTTNIALPEGYKEKLERRRYSKNTVNAYCSLFKQFQAYLSPNSVEDATVKDIEYYLDYIVKRRKLKSSSQNQIVNAIKFYYEKVLGYDKMTFEIDRPKKEKSLPNVLSEEQVKTILTTTENLKHKTILGLLYSAGLRNGELINLRIHDIMWDKNMIVVRGGKGKKDRTTLLSEKMKIVLKKYLEHYKPTYYLIEGPNNTKYSQSSVRAIFKQALQKAGISLHFRVHDLRHSFGTHLIEKGINLRYVQELLGHGSSKTTEIYTHVAKTKFNEIKNPLDDIF